MKTNSLEGEFIESIRVLFSTALRVSKVGPRNAMVICSLSRHGYRYCEKVIGVAMGQCLTPCRAKAAEEHIAEYINWDSMTVKASAIEEFVNLVKEATNPIDDHRSQLIQVAYYWFWLKGH